MNLDELKLILDAHREQELRNQKFLAAIQGIDIDKNTKEKAEEDFKRVEQRVQARLAGISEKKLEYDALGFEIEEED